MAKNKTDIWLPIYVGDYLADTMHLTTEQHGAYFLLIMAYWKNRGALPENRIQGIVNINGNSWSIAEALLKEYFDTTTYPGKWYHKRIEEELEKALIRKQAAENRGKKGSDVRWKDKTTDSSTNGSTIVEGIVGDSSSPSPSPSLKETHIGKDEIKEKIKKEKKPFIPPTIEEAKAFFREKGYKESVAERAWMGYDVADWYNRNGKKVQNWKQTFVQVWFKDENKDQTQPLFQSKSVEDLIS
jgi:uncharacterized protein YdaU (DUF1376 family)